MVPIARWLDFSSCLQQRALYATPSEQNKQCTMQMIEKVVGLRTGGETWIYRRHYILERIQMLLWPWILSLCPWRLN
jgi:hypothetical protein